MGTCRRALFHPLSSPSSQKKRRISSRDDTRVKGKAESGKRKAKPWPGNSKPVGPYLRHLALAKFPSPGSSVPLAIGKYSPSPRKQGLFFLEGSIICTPRRPFFPSRPGAAASQHIRPSPLLSHRAPSIHQTLCSRPGLSLFAQIYELPWPRPPAFYPTIFSLLYFEQGSPGTIKAPNRKKTLPAAYG
jgi:hypothetical protein